MRAADVPIVPRGAGSGLTGAANANDGYGIAGISWTDRILPVKIMNREGTVTRLDVYYAS